MDRAGSSGVWDPWHSLLPRSEGGMESSPASPTRPSAWFYSGKDPRGKLLGRVRIRPYAKAMDEGLELRPKAPKWSQSEKQPGSQGAMRVRGENGGLTRLPYRAKAGLTDPYTLHHFPE